MSSPQYNVSDLSNQHRTMMFFPINGEDIHSLCKIKSFFGSLQIFQRVICGIFLFSWSVGFLCCAVIFSAYACTHTLSFLVLVNYTPAMKFLYTDENQLLTRIICLYCAYTLPTLYPYRFFPYILCISTQNIYEKLDKLKQFQRAYLFLIELDAFSIFKLHKKTLSERTF